MIAGLTLRQFYFELFPETNRATRAAVFLQHVRRVIASKLLVIWDGLPAHQIRLVRDWLA